MNFILANGDTENPLVFIAKGIHSPFGTSLEILAKSRNDTEKFRSLILETKDLIDECDECHTRALVHFPHNAIVESLAVQWALISRELSEIVAEVKTLTERGDIPEEKIGLIAVIYDLLVTRRMTFLLNDPTD